ncbi:unnamed protein product [Nezara viridula]|uniref:Uncharacterized protein n=1 Tax=Nezara viridula TaxID=85310 RepID=A0A9P0H4A2_NEZVI|nr:unnamed protein product [Nezara viridula]
MQHSARQIHASLALRIASGWCLIVTVLPRSDFLALPECQLPQNKPWTSFSPTQNNLIGLNLEIVVAI